MVVNCNQLHLLVYVVLLQLLAIVPNNVKAYRVSGSNYFAEAPTCNRFLTKLGDGFQMRALTLKNSSDEWYTALEVAENCKMQLSEMRGFEQLMTKYPTEVNYDLRIGQASNEAELLRVNVLATWQDLDGEVDAICDYYGNAYFYVPNGLRGAGKCYPQTLAVKDWKANETFQLEDAFILNLQNNQGLEPVLGEGVLITPVICRVKPVDSTAGRQQIVWPSRRNMEYALSLSAEFRHSWGLLHPQMYAELLLMCVIIAPKALLIVWYLYRCRQFRDHVMTQQKYFVFVSVFSLSAGVLFSVFLAIANVNGTDTCCPTPPLSAFFQGLKVMSSMSFDLLVLATAKGWGVVSPKLESQDQRKIMLFFAVSFLIYFLSQVLQPSFPLAWLVVWSETSIWVWIFYCLTQTRKDLSVSTRLDRHAKLDMYVKLHKLLCMGLALWLLILSVEIAAILIVFNQDGRFILYDIPPTLAWDLALLMMMYGFGWIWRPSPATAQFAYTFTRQEEDGVDARDPVSDFGLEST